MGLQLFTAQAGEVRITTAYGVYKACKVSQHSKDEGREDQSLSVLCMHRGPHLLSQMYRHLYNPSHPLTLAAQRKPHIPATGEALPLSPSLSQSCSLRSEHQKYVSASDNRLFFDSLGRKHNPSDDCYKNPFERGISTSLRPCEIANALPYIQSTASTAQTQHQEQNHPNQPLSPPLHQNLPAPLPPSPGPCPGG